MYFLRYGNSTSDNQLILDSGKAEKIDVDGHGEGWQKKKKRTLWHGPSIDQYGRGPAAASGYSSVNQSDQRAKLTT